MIIEINGDKIDTDNIDEKQLPLFILMKLQDMHKFMRNEKKINRKIITAIGVIALAIVALHGPEVLNVIAKIF